MTSGPDEAVEAAREAISGLRLVRRGRPGLTSILENLVRFGYELGVRDGAEAAREDHDGPGEEC